MAALAQQVTTEAALAVNSDSLELSLDVLAVMCAAQGPTPRSSASSPVRISGISTDSRRVRTGELFVALSGVHHDGHDHVAAAVTAGAAALLLAQDKPVFDTGVPVLKVPDTRQALCTLAASWRRRQAGQGIAVCGSNGKTTVKNMLAAILQQALGTEQVLTTLANYNNDLGVALTLLALRPQHRAFVVELGSNHPGELLPLAVMAQAHVALITNAQRDHQEFFTDAQGSACENAAVFSALDTQGIAVFPADPQHETFWRQVAAGRRCLTFGELSHADVRLLRCLPTPGGQSVQLAGLPGVTDLRLQVPGRHNALNALAAASAAMALGIKPEAIRRGLALFNGTPGRLSFYPLASRGYVIDDSYNANADSVLAAIDVLASQPGQRWLVLGDLGECGSHAAAAYAEIGLQARHAGIERLLTLGKDSLLAAEAFGHPQDHAATFEALCAALLPLPETMTVLVKGSRFMRMERVVHYLLTHAASLIAEEF